MHPKCRQLFDSGYTTEQLTEDSLAIMRVGSAPDMLDWKGEDEFLEWAVGNAWRTAYWKLPNSPQRDIADRTPAREMLTAEQIQRLLQRIEELK